MKISFIIALLSSLGAVITACLFEGDTIELHTAIKTIAICTLVFIPSFATTIKKSLSSANEKALR